MSKKAAIPFENQRDLAVALKFAAKYDNATRKGHHFDLSLERMGQIIDKGICEFTGEPFTSLTGDDGDNVLTIDRIDPRVGYIDGNTIGVAKWVNNLKATTLDALMHNKRLTAESKIKMLRKSLYRLEKEVKEQKAKDAEAAAKLAEQQALIAGKVKIGSLAAVLTTTTANSTVSKAAAKWAKKYTKTK